MYFSPHLGSRHSPQHARRKTRRRNSESGDGFERGHDCDGFPWPGDRQADYTGQCQWLYPPPLPRPRHSMPTRVDNPPGHTMFYVVIVKRWLSDVSVTRMRVTIIILYNIIYNIFFSILTCRNRLYMCSWLEKLFFTGKTVCSLYMYAEQWSNKFKPKCSYFWEFNGN